MGVFEIIGGILLILCAVAIVLMVLLQESKGNGLSGVIGGGEMMTNDSRQRTGTAILAKYTKYAAIAFFVLTILVSVFNIYFSK